MRATATMVGSLLVLTVLGGSARGADFCIQVSEGDTTRYVGKRFRIPGPGKCKPWNGIYLPSFATVSVSTGTACTTSDGAKLRIHLVTMRETVAFNDYVVLPLPALTGGTIDEVVAQFGPTITHIEGVSAGRCDPPNVPIP